MATKEINFVIKVNNKQVDLSKTSFEQFDKVIKQAKKDLQSLPLTDPRYKVLSTDIKNAEASWKAAQKAANGMNDEMDDGEEKIKSYTAEIKKLNLANRELEEQGKKNSKEYEDNVAKIKQLKDAQEEMSRSTQKLDDALSNIPGPIGQIGSSMQQLESISGSAQSAFKSLGLGFETFDKTIKTSLVGFLVGLLVTLVSAVMEAAKSFQPLKDAFAKMGDAVGALFNALKPVTDFLLNVFVSVVTSVAQALSSVAEFFGGTNNHLAETTAKMDKQLANQEKAIKAYTGALSEYAQAYSEALLQFTKDENEATKAVKASEMTMAEFYDTMYFLNVQKNNKLSDLAQEWAKKQAIQLNELGKLQADNEDEMIVSAIERQKEQLKSEEVFNENLLRLDRLSAKSKKEQLEQNRYALEKSDVQDKDAALAALDQSISDQTILIAYYDDKLVLSKQHLNNQLSLIDKEQARDALHAKNDANLKSQELTQYMIKNDAEREVKAAKDAKNRLSLTHSEELDEIKRNQGEKSDVYKYALNRQAAEIAAEQDKIRVAELNRDVSYYTDAIELEKSFLSTKSENTLAYYQTQEHLVQMEYDKAIIAADGNKQKQLIAENERDNKLYQLKVDYLNSIAELQERHAQTLNDHTTAYFEAERLAEETAYAARLKAAKDNTDLILVIEEEHQKKLRDLKKSELQAYGETASAVLDSIAAVGNAIASTYDEEAKTSESAFNKRKDLQIATAKMSAASGIIQILTQPSTLPSPFDWITKGLNAAALLIATTAQINTIKKTQFKGSESGNKPNYGDGGMIDGARHAQGGVAINAEGGEAIMSRGSVTMFKPLLSMMNQMGGGTSFSRGAVGQANFDNPSTNTGSSEQPIIKTYVVSNELTTDAHRAARLKDLSTL